MMADVREGGAWTPLQRAKNDVLYVALSAALLLASRLPPFALRGLGRALGAAAWAVPHLRRRAVANVARALALPAEEARALARRSFATLGRLLADTVASFDARRPLATLPLAPGARACLDGAIAEGKGVVFASAHLGAWERVAASLVAAGVPLTVVAREPYDPRLQWVYDRLRGGRGVPAIYRGRPGAPIALVRTLRRGGVLAIPMDLATRAPSLVVPFLGQPARTALGPARLALRTGAAVVVGTVTPCGAAISFERIAVGGLTEQALTARLNEALGARIRALPEAWPWMHDRWANESSPEA